MSRGSTQRAAAGAFAALGLFALSACSATGGIPGVPGIQATGAAPEPAPTLNVPTPEPAPTVPTAPTLPPTTAPVPTPSDTTAPTAPAPAPAPTESAPAPEPTTAPLPDFSDPAAADKFVDDKRVALARAAKLDFETATGKPSAAQEQEVQDAITAAKKLKFDPAKCQKIYLETSLVPGPDLATVELAGTSKTLGNTVIGVSIVKDASGHSVPDAADHQLGKECAKYVMTIPSAKPMTRTTTVSVQDVPGQDGNAYVITYKNSDSDGTKGTQSQFVLTKDRARIVVISNAPKATFAQDAAVVADASMKALLGSAG